MEQTVVTQNEVVPSPPSVETEGEEQAAEIAAEVAMPAVEAPSAEAATEDELAALRAEVEALQEALAAKAGGEQVEELRALVESAQATASEELEEGQRQREALRVEAQAAADRLAERLTGTDQALAEAMVLLRPRARVEIFDPMTVPPDVLRGAYEQTATDVYGRMRQTLGEHAAEQRVRAIMERVRRITAGMEFFRLTGDRQIIAPGLSAALRRRLISPHQIHITFNEFLRNLLEAVPGYQPPPLRELVDTGTQAYTVNTVTQLLEETETMRTVLKDSAPRLESLERFARNEPMARGKALASLESRLTSALETATEELGARLADLSERLAALEARPEPRPELVEGLVEGLVEEQRPEPAEEGEVRQPRTVFQNGTISIGGTRYYVGRKLAGEEVQVEVGEAEVRIYHQGELIKTHARKT